MSTWQQFVQQGILGTARQPTPPLLPSGAVVSESQEHAAQDDEQRFLHAAAIFAQYEAAGMLPSALESQPGLHELVASPPETQPAVESAAAQLLQQIMADFDRNLLVEWLQHAAQQEAHLPHDTLPFLLEQATKEQALAAALVPCLGERGRWLLALNPAWQIDAAEALDEAHWQDGRIEARVGYLQSLRQEEPALARSLLATVWRDEPVANRAALLATLRTNLSAADLPFLEDARSDRGSTVRLQACRLLVTMPETTVHQALMAHLTSALRVERRWLKRQFVVTVPGAFREEWREFGVRDDSALGVRLGPKMGWLVQLIALVPPSTLVTALGVDAVELLDLIRVSNHAEALISALLEGAEQHQDYAFLLAELEHLLRLLALSQVAQGEFVDRFGRYASILPHAERSLLLQRYLELTERQAFNDWAMLQTILRHCGALSPAITGHLLTKQLPALLQRHTRDYGIGRILLEVAYQLAPTAYPQAEILFQRRQGEERPDYIDRFLQIYHFRHQMAQAFRA